MHREMQATHPAGSKWLFGIPFFLIPSLLAFAWVSALSRNASPASALWFLYEVSRLLAYIGIVISTGLTLGIAIRRTASGLFVAFRRSHDFIHRQRRAVGLVHGAYL